MKSFQIFTNYKIDEISLIDLLLDKFNLKVENLYSEIESVKEKSDCRIEFHEYDFEYKYGIDFWSDKKINLNYLKVCREIAIYYKIDVITGLEWEKNINQYDLCLFESNGKIFTLFAEGDYSELLVSKGYLTEEEHSKLSINIFPMMETKKEISFDDLDNLL